MSYVNRLFGQSFDPSNPPMVVPSPAAASPQPQRREVTGFSPTSAVRPFEKIGHSSNRRFS